MNARVLNVVRLQYINKQTYLWVPLIVLAGSLVISFLIFAMIPVDTPKYGGGSQAPLWYFLAVGIQSLTLTFPFSQAMSLTRREFYLGTLIAASATSAMLATAFVIIGALELATNGFGVNGYFAHLPYVWEAGPLAAWVVYFIIAMFFFVIGFWCATIYKRWGSAVLTTVLIALGLLLVGVVYLITRLNAWPEVWTWLVTTGAVGLSLWAVPIIALMGVGSYSTLRRATV
ncbi:hypothetical protein [Microbacterium sp.]|uniref:hypothetical protein n=1 Tax=Microbacterium sp. TaxID=51671 RepID=UPI002811BAA7|nr:hypothetical protein [Microbacterium sp.]